jgi:hypothetical protein
MEDKFNPDNFEKFLQDQVRNQRMYPNDAVWRDINKTLHGEKRWPALTVAAFLLLSVTVAICFHFTRKSDIFSLKPTLEPLSVTRDIAQNNTSTNQSDKTAAYPSYRNNFANARPAKDSNAVENQVNSGTTNQQSITAATIMPSTTKTKTSIPVASNNNTFKKLNISIAPIKEIETAYTDTYINSSIASSIAVDNIRSTTTIAVDSKEKKQVVDNESGKRSLSEEDATEAALQTIRKPNNVKHKLGYQIYVSPSFSYRKLAEDRSVLKDNVDGPVGLNYVTDVNKVVRHRPGTGIEAGLSIFYNISDRIKVKSGLQFNVRQYSIDAYKSYSETASIALIGGNRVDTINTIAIYRNNNGYKSAKLINRYYQVALPVGLEWEVIGNRRMRVNVAASIQPTYLMNRNTYLLSTNFKNYTENPGMVRQWNLNSNIEAFISYKVGDFKWQIGPQVRYQPYSTFISEYPIKEHLLDYGVKVGVSKSF